MSSARVLGIAQDASGKWTGLYHGLGEHFEVVDVIRPRASRPVWVTEILRNSRANLRDHTIDPGWSVRMFDSRTRSLDAELAGRPPAGYDIIVQAQTLCAPGRGSRQRPYVVYTDSTHALNQRHRFGGDPTPGRPGVRLRARERAVAGGAAHVFTMSAFARASMIADYGCDPDAVTVVGAGVNLAVPEDRDASDRPRAILVGLDLERKGGHEVLAAWPAVRAAIAEAELVIVGPPPGAPAPGVRWTGRVRSREELSRLYAAATVFVLPTLWDPWGLVYHEAMAHALPCIGTDAFAVPEIIADTETGLLVPPRAPEAVAAALIELLSDPSRAAAMGLEAQRRVRRDATWSAVAARMAPVIEGLSA